MNTKPLVLIANRFDHGTYLQAQAGGQAQFLYSKNLNDLSEYFLKCRGLIVRSSTLVDKALLKKMPELEFIITATSGFDHLNLLQIKERGVKAFHIPETQSVAAAELTILMILGACRKFSLAQSQLKKGVWDRQILLGKQLSGQSLGIIGLGKVGTEVAKRAQVLGLNVQAHDPYIQEHRGDIPMLGFEELMRTSDIVSLHVPKTKRTRYMIKKETLDWMSSEAILINMSRGDVVKEEDLVSHLQSNPSFRAALDVFENEPLAKNSKLQNLDNVILSPHIGASTTEALKESSRRSVEIAQDLLNGKDAGGKLPPNTLWWNE